MTKHPCLTTRSQRPLLKWASPLSASGQSLVEFSLVLPLALVLVLGVVEVGYALLDVHVVTKLAREGSNMISRDTSLQDAALAMRSMSTRPVDFSTSSKVIFSVIKKGANTGTSNFNAYILYRRYEYGSYSGASSLTTAGTGSFGSGPDYQAVNSDNDTSLQLTNLPPALAGSAGMIFVTEIYNRHTLITPLDHFGIQVPQALYSIAYF